MSYDDPAGAGSRVEATLTAGEQTLMDNHYLSKTDLAHIREAVACSTYSLVHGYVCAHALLSRGYDVEFVLDALVLGTPFAERRLVEKLQRELGECG